MLHTCKTFLLRLVAQQIFKPFILCLLKPNRTLSRSMSLNTENNFAQ